jgi:glycerate 2-kinase
VSVGLAEMRAMARRLFAAAVGAADPALAVRRHFLARPDTDASILIAVGKAAPAMLAEAMAHLPGARLALAVTHRGNETRIPGARVLAAGHPLPDDAGIEAGRAVLSALDGAGMHDRVLALISGGGSALIPAPRAPLTLADKQAVNGLLLASGLDITAMNLVRQQLSELKGGGFLRHAAPAPVTALILSDVIGNELAAVASGPTLPPLGNRGQACRLLHDAGLWEQLPKAARAMLHGPMPEPAALPAAENHLIGSNEQSLHAMRDAVGPGWIARIVSDRLTGDVGNAASLIARATREAPPDRPTALIFGGETTVTLRGTGRGGRNQELALRVADAMHGWSGDWVFLSGGTDGRDGPTEAAGGLVDGGSMARIAASGADARMLLANNDSHAALAAAGDLLLTGATGTNVADVQAMLVK